MLMAAVEPFASLFAVSAYRSNVVPGHWSLDVTPVCVRVCVRVRVRVRARLPCVSRP